MSFFTASLVNEEEGDSMSLAGFRGLIKAREGGRKILLPVLELKNPLYHCLIWRLF